MAKRWSSRWGDDGESRQDGSWRSSRSSPRSEFWGIRSQGGSDSSDRRWPSGNCVATNTRSSDTASWRRPPSTSVDSNSTSSVATDSEETSSRAPARLQKRPQPSAMQRGKILTLKLKEGYCFIEGKLNNIYCKLDKAETGMLEVEIGDIMEYISNDSPDNPRVMYARLVHCNQRSLEALDYYLTALSERDQDSPGRVLREITKCPVGFLQVLNIPKPAFHHVRAVVKLANTLSDHNHALSYTARLKQFYGLFRGTVFLKSSGALREFCMEMLETRTEEMWLKMFVKRLVEHSPGSVSEVLPLVNVMVETTPVEKIHSHCRFLLDLLSTQAGIALGSVAWDKMQLLPTDMELRDFSTDESTKANSVLSGLPYVKKKGSYGTVEAYLDTYFRLLKEDCFWGVKRGISKLRRGSLDPRDMRVWMEGHVMGIHFGRSYSGIAIAIQVKSLGNGARNRFPMAGSLVCLSDDGGNFESPIWATVAHCEEAGRGDFTIFVQIEDGLSYGRAEEVEVQSIGRLLGASNVVVAESPTFYKAYQPVLKSLQQKDLHKFPFIEELVHARCPYEPPEYLTSSTTVDWRCLFEERGKLIEDGISCSTDEHAAMRSNIKELDTLLRYGGCRTTLDDSQLEAIKLALNNRLALIQGPPGTGKTYVGAKIVELLLTADTLSSGPIVVVTYKNHALDQFLLSCLKFCKKLVRVGGRSTEALLQQYNLKHLVNKVDEFSPDWTDCTYRMVDAQDEMKVALLHLQESSAFNAESVIRHMPHRQLRQFLAEYESDTNLLEQIPDEISIVDLIDGEFGRDKQFGSLLPKLYRAVTKIIKEWMPKTETFQLIENCLCVCKPPRGLNEACLGPINSGISTKPESDSCGDVEDEDYIDLEEYYREYLDQDAWVDEFMMASHRPSRKRQVTESWLQDSNFCRFRVDGVDTSFSKVQRLSHMDVSQYRWLLNENPWHLNEYQRALLVLLIMQTNYEMALKRFADLKKSYDDTLEVIKDIRKFRQLQVLQNAQIVGMTTTGAAMYGDVLKMLCPAIVFVEEAAEILEPQVLAFLGPSIQHLILIGDHYQLYPRVQCHELEHGHDFGVSMFERLVEHNDMPFQMLSVQSRMRDEFLPMITPIYHNVRSNITLVSGKRNKAPDCMMSPMHFWSHSFEESKDHQSFTNEGEAQMVIALLCWMISEGENHEEISVLAAYSGQVALLRDKLRAYESLKDIPVYTIDRFQGSENRIIIASLVRSNEEGNIGYLAKRNRFCVAVSRARGAVYFCGNDTTLVKRSEHWCTLANYLKEQGCLSDQIHLCCPRHALDPPFTLGSDNVDVFNPLMCQRPCRAKLECEHYCQSTCHYGDHPICMEEVQFVFKSCGHEATKKCTENEATKRCEKEISFTFELCGHTDVFQCWKTLSKGLKCFRLCSKKLECGHPCTLKCFQDCKTNPCAVCVEIEKDKSRKQKLQETRELELKMKELETEINRLKSQDDPELVSVEDIDPDGERAAEYLQVKDLTEKFIQPRHGIFPAVTRIEKVSNLRLQIKFLECQKDLLSPTSPTRLLFHGTDDAGIQGIIREGFRLPPENKDNMFGQGCYFATDSSKSAQQIYTKGSNKLLLCEVLLGRTWTVQEAYPKMDSDKIKKKGYDSLFSKREGKGTGGTLYDEFVIYNPHQAISRYIVHYKNLFFDPATIPSHIPTQQNLIRIPYEMSTSFSGDNLAEYHFRLAESQFFRMSKKFDSKVVKVEYILNKMLLTKYEAAKDELAKQKKNVEEMLVFHGTDKDAIEKIIDEGFKIGGQGVELRNGKLYGSGVYTALDPDTSINYSKGGMILLSSALVGEEGVDYNKGGSPDVLVLRKTDHLLPKYIVHFTNR